MSTLKNKPKILICDDNQTIHLAIKSTFSGDYELKSAFNSEEAIVILKKNQMDLVLLDMEIEHSRSGLELIPKILELQEDLKIIIFSGNQSFDAVKNALKLGAHDYILKDAGVDELKHALSKTLQFQQASRQNQQSQFELKKQHSSNMLIGDSAPIQKIKKQIEKAKNSPAPVIVFGETGTGKEVIARSLRKTLADGSLEPFIAVDSSTIQSSVAESVLFGYEKGAFTGAEKSTRGLFEEANGGTLYFDELGNMPIEIQNKLLRVVQEKEVLRMGSSKPISLDFRVICATNQNLEELTKQGKFKEDLYQRLCVLQIDAPPLRERIEDVSLLLECFAERYKGTQEKLKFLPETIEILKNYTWPGNVREVSNLVLYLYTMCDESFVSPLDLPPKLSKEALKAPQTAASPGKAPLDSKTFYEAVANFEQGFLKEKYEIYEGNVSKMAASLEMDRSYLHGKLKNFGIHSIRKSN
jgi:two-component system nitrogen regulation response regulator NtrX